MVQREQYTLEKSLKIALMVMSCPRSHSQSVVKSPRQGAKEHIHIWEGMEERRGQAGVWTLVKWEQLSETADTQISDTVFTLSLLQGSCSGMFLWAISSSNSKEKIRLFIFNSSCRNILKGEKRSMCPPGKGFSLRVTVLALTKQVYDTQESRNSFQEKGI